MDSAFSVLQNTPAVLNPTVMIPQSTAFELDTEPSVNVCGVKHSLRSQAMSSMDVNRALFIWGSVSLLIIICEK